MTAGTSLERRLNLGVGLGLAALLLVGSIMLCLAMRLIALQFVEDRLRHDLDTLIAASTATEGTTEPGFERLPLVYQQAYSGHYYRVAGAGGVARSRSLWDAELPVPTLAGGQSWRGGLPGPDDQWLLVLAQGIATKSGVRVVAVAEDIAPLQAQLHRLTIAIPAFALAILAALLWLQQVLVRRSLRPLLRLQDHLREMERGERTELPTADVPSEVLPLVQRLNGLLGLLAARLERSRKSLGNLAHALKTPLAVMTQTTADVDGPAGRQLSQQVAQMRDTVDRELRRARLAGGASLGARFDLRQELDALVDTLRRIYRDKPLTVDIECSADAGFSGDREDFLELMGVLLDNAFKWAHSRVRIAIEGNDALRIAIEDDGPGIDPVQQARLLERGQRLDERLPGAGLGLAIARDMVEQYEGRLTLERSPLGGLLVSLQLPGRTVR